MTNAPAATLGLAALLLGSCSAGVSGGAATGSGGSPGTPADAADAPAGGGSGGSFMVGDGPAGDQASCAFRAFSAARVPLDLVLLVDASGSMNDPPISGGIQSKWQLTREALVKFIRDPGSAGVGMGLQFFPLLGEGSPCATAADCKPTTTPAPDWLCQEQSRCVPESAEPDNAPWCSPPFGAACLGTECLLLGLCAMTGTLCVPVGQPCAGGVAGDICLLQPQTCQSAPVVCEAAAYQQLAAPIAELPAGALPLVRLLHMRRPGATTPMAEAAIGTLTNLRNRLTAMPGRHAALIVATDGLPAGCSNQDIPTIADTLYTASQTAPHVPTYVIGVLNAGDDRAYAESAFGQLARAGGTRAPFILDPALDLTQKLAAALDLIRSDALPCEYEIPADPSNAIDYGQVNVHVTGRAGEEDIPYAASAAQCDPTRGGWTYDVNPASAKPKRVIACPASCERLKTDLGAKVELRFGCKTIVVP